MIQPGPYPEAEAVEAKWTKSSKGNEGFSVKCRVTDDHGEEAELWGTVWFTPKTIHGGFAKRQLDVLGLDPEETRVTDYAEKVQGNVFPVVVEENRGQLRIGLFGRGQSAPSAEALEKLDAKLRGEKPPADSFDGGEDIPF